MAGPRRVGSRGIRYRGILPLGKLVTTIRNSSNLRL
eukprot:SAG31_NODE_23861_length_494_cov_0.777215_2_plen_35_part_01